MLDAYYQMLAERIDPALIQTPTTDQRIEANSDLKGKNNLSLLGQSRKQERFWKNNQRRSVMSRSSAFLKKKPDLLKPNTVTSTANVETSLLGNVGN